MANSPTDVLRRYLDATEAYDFATAWPLMCAEYRRSRPLEEYLAVMGALPRGGVPERSYGEEQIVGVEATVVVTWMSPDPDGMRALGEDVRAGRLSPEQYGHRVRTGDIPRKARPETFRLLLEDGDWRVAR